MFCFSKLDRLKYKTTVCSRSSLTSARYTIEEKWKYFLLCSLIKFKTSNQLRVALTGLA